MECRLKVVGVYGVLYVRGHVGARPRLLLIFLLVVTDKAVFLKVLAFVALFVLVAAVAFVDAVAAAFAEVKLRHYCYACQLKGLK